MARLTAQQLATLGIKSKDQNKAPEMPQDSDTQTTDTNASDNQDASQDVSQSATATPKKTTRKRTPKATTKD